MHYYHYQLRTAAAKAWIQQFEAYKIHMLDLATTDPVAFALLVEPQRPKEVRIIDQIAQLDSERLAHVTAGRTRGGGAGAFNRMYENFTHKITLLRNKLDELGFESGHSSEP